MLHYSTQKILGVKSVSVKKLHGYGHLEEVVVKRADRQLYQFKEGDFVDLHLNDIEDMLLLAVQHKLFHLNESDIVNFIVALRMFTRSLVIKKHVEDLQLGVEILRRDTQESSDEIHHRVLDFRLGYNDEMSRRKCTAIDKKRSQLMVELMDKQMRERRIIRNLELLVGARELEMDYKLMTHHEPVMHAQPFTGHSSKISVMPKSIHSDDENPSRANIKPALCVDAPVMRTASAAAKPCHSLEFYLITGSIYTD
ncbi:hypothetical protein Tco_0959952 [Tanacetum coccineum]